MSKQWIRKEESGKRYGRLIVQKFSHIGSGNTAYWLCLCDCGTIKTIAGSHLRNSATQSCGCFCKQQSARAKYRHGYTFGGIIPREYKIWVGIRKRCLNPKDEAFKYYGGRGIKICDSWLASFENFFKDMGKSPPGMSINRKNNDGDYCPENCAWATAKEQNNNSRNCHLITFNGITKNVTAWAVEVGIKTRILQWRIYKGWTIERALQSPAFKNNDHIRGEGNVKSKLTDLIVRKMRSEYKPYNRTAGSVALAKKYGVAPSLAFEAIKGTRWGHIK